jgi:nucleoside-diphosphate-sugar epimerase
VKFFVTGGTGFLGSHLIRQLRAAEHEVTTLVRGTTALPAVANLVSLGCTLAGGSITTPKTLRKPMTGVDGVFHVAGWYKLGVRDDREAVRTNVEGTRNVLETMRDLGIPRGVFTSTLAVNSDTRGKIVDETYRFRGKHLTIYDRTKWQAHYEVALPLIEQGLPLVIVMPGVIYGPGDQSLIHDMFERLVAGKLSAIPKRTAYCWSHAEDIAAGHIAAMLRGRPGESYMLAGPAHTIEQALIIAGEIASVPLPRRRVSPWMMQAAAAVTSMLRPMFTLPKDLDPEVLRASGGATYLGSDAKAREELGFAPRSLEAGLRETLKHQCRQFAQPEQSLRP